jgi:dipeptidyl-peptidase-4
MIAFFRFDETEVPEISLDIYGDQLYPVQQRFKYPKAGQNNSKVSLHFFDLKTAKTFEIELGDLGQHYLPRMKWTSEPYSLVLTSLNRHQNNLNLILVNAKENGCSLLMNEKDEAYVDVRDDLTFLNDNSFIWSSERDGFNHLYHFSKEGKLKNQVTQGIWEVTNFYGYDPGSDRIFYQSTEEGSINRSVYSVTLSGTKKKKLTRLVGENNAAFSKSFRYFVNTHSNESTPTSYTLTDARSGKELKVVKNNQALAEKLNDYVLSEKEFTTLKTKNGEFNMYMIKPADFDPNRKYPLLMFQYSGPGSQRVVNRFNEPGRHDYWHQMLAQEGFIIACVDGRGTGFKGRDFKKITYKELGKLELQDQIEAAKELGRRSYIDQSRIGIWGWSFGGYMSSLAITKGADVFKMAIAVAPVTSWRFYDTVYTERFLQTPEENPSGYDDNSPLNFAHLLEGDYLLIHGTGDDNVHVQNSMRMINALVDANKQFDYFGYPDRAHGIRKGRNTRYHLFQKMTTFIRNSLGSPSDTEQKLNN